MANRGFLPEMKVESYPREGVLQAPEPVFTPPTGDVRLLALGADGCVRVIKMFHQYSDGKYLGMCNMLARAQHLTPEHSPQAIEEGSRTD
jgi:hypothetical protein